MKEFELIDESKKGNKKYKNSGIFEIVSCNLETPKALIKPSPSESEEDLTPKKVKKTKLVPKDKNKEKEVVKDKPKKEGIPKSLPKRSASYAKEPPIPPEVTQMVKFLKRDDNIK
jgi:hypothetical protein